MNTLYLTSFDLARAGEDWDAGYAPAQRRCAAAGQKQQRDADREAVTR